jgi:hypothetical protein
VLKIIALLVFTTQLYASSIHLDIGQSEAVFNRFAIPNTDQDRINLPTDGTLTSFRLTGYFDLASGNQLYVLLAPLATSYSFDATKNFEFNDENFTSGTDTQVDYKFNSYRIGYLWKWKLSSLNVWAGFVGKIRDAEIKVTQGSTSSAFDNVGFVPLASVGAELFLTKSLSLFTHTDALGASQGSAYDSQIEVKYGLEKFALSLGRRILGGGADNDRVYNFAQFDTNYLRLSYLF